MPRPDLARPRLRILLTNAFSIYNKLGEFQHLLTHHDVDIAVVTETKLTPEKATQAEVTLTGYHPPIRKDRTAQGGGVAIWVRHGIPHRQLDFASTQETVWISVALDAGTRVAVCGAYRPGSLPDHDTTLFDQLEADIDKARQACSNIIVAGDFNAHNRQWLGSNHTTPAGEAAENLCYLQSLEQHVTGPTRGNATLDLVLSDLPGAVHTALHPPLGRSDHAVIITDFQTVPSRDLPATRTVWRYKKADWPRLSAFYRTTAWDQLITEDPDTSCEQVTNHILKGMHQFIPSKKLKVRSSDPVWWTPECSAAITTKRQAWRRHQKHRADPELSAAYKQACSTSQACLARAKQAHLEHNRARLAAGSMQDREWWSVIKRSGGLGKDSSIPVLVDEQGQEHTRNKEKADVLGQYFAKKCSLEHDFNATQPLPPVRSRTQNTIQIVHFRPATVRRTLLALNSSKATGPDSVPARVLKACADSLALPLSKLFALCFRNQCQPVKWKCANVVPTSDLLIALQHEWHQATSRGGLVRVLAVDVAGAFDKVSHRGLLHKAEQYGVTGPLLHWLRSYLSHRRISVTIGGQASATYEIKSGVPQGSILGPTLFLIYTNDAEDHLPTGAKLAVYADDTTMYRPRDNVPTINFQGTTVAEVEELKLLGITFDTQLSFTEHVRNLARRGAQRLGFFRKAAAHLSTRHRATVYRGFVRPVLEYGMLVWMGASDTSLARLSAVQRKGLHVIGEGSFLPSLAIRRMVAALCFLYKLHYTHEPRMLADLLPPPAPPPVQLRTRSTVRGQAQHHRLQLAQTAAPQSRNNVLRSFPHAAIATWNCLPQELLPGPPTLKGMPTFKKKVYHHLRQQDWEWATDFL